jgi:hypothetical protein
MLAVSQATPSAASRPVMVAAPSAQVSPPVGVTRNCCISRVRAAESGPPSATSRSAVSSTAQTLCSVANRLTTLMPPSSVGGRSSQRAARPDDVERLQPQRLQRDGRGLVEVGLQRHPPLLGDDGTVVAGGIETDPGAVTGHGLGSDS